MTIQAWSSFQHVPLTWKTTYPVKSNSWFPLNNINYLDWIFFLYFFFLDSCDSVPFTSMKYSLRLKRDIIQGFWYKLLSSTWKKTTRKTQGLRLPSITSVLMIRFLWNLYCNSPLTKHNYSSKKDIVGQCRSEKMI